MCRSTSSAEPMMMTTRLQAVALPRGALRKLQYAQLTSAIASASADSTQKRSYRPCARTSASSICSRITTTAASSSCFHAAHTTAPHRGVAGFTGKDREEFSPEQKAEWNELDEMEKLRRDPSLYSSPLAIDTESTSDRLLDDAWIIDPAKREGTVIWLHGIGEGMAEAKKIFEMLAPKNLRVVVPKAPYIPITALEEEEHNTWYDIETAIFTDEVDEDYRGIKESAAKVTQLLDEESQLVPPGRIILAGFGQGGALAIHAGLQYGVPLGGILSFAGYVALPEDLPELIHPANKSIKILAVHGKSDEVCPISFAKKRYEVLKESGVSNFELREDFYLEHRTSEQTIFEMMRWFEEQVALDGRRAAL